MDSRLKNILMDIKKVVTSRAVIIGLVFFAGFYAVVIKLFELQIVNGANPVNDEVLTAAEPIYIAAPRGEIYDKYGRPLAVNEMTYILKIDSTLKPENSTQLYINLSRLLAESGEEVIDDFPMTLTEPFRYAETLDSEARKRRWLEDMGLLNQDELDESDALKASGAEVYVKLTAEDAFRRLRDKFSIPEDMSASEARKVLSLISMVYMERYNLNPVTVAVGVKQTTVIALEERSEDFPGVYTELGYLRHYPESELFSHVIGYIRKADEADLAEFAEFDYTASDIVGKTGLERQFERVLVGEKGVEVAEIDSSLKRVGTLSEKDPVPGDDLVLTLDRDVTEKAYDILEGYMRDILIEKIRGTGRNETHYSNIDVAASMIRSNNVSVEEIMQSPGGSGSAVIRDYVRANADLPQDAEDYLERAKEYIAEGVEEGDVLVSSVMLALYEQGLITLEDDQISRLRNDGLNTTQLFIDKIADGEITPQMTNLNPHEGSIVLTDVRTGDVIASVGYPTYDANQYVNTLNIDYFNKSINDPTGPEINRPFYSLNPPGSTFKMITALSALENGIITPETTIRDAVVFTDAGDPPASCMNKSGHGSINVTEAIKVSCNYFFYDVSYRMGNQKNDSWREGIATLNQTMRDFGLDERTGVEISEMYDNWFYASAPSRLSSPEYFDYLQTNLYPEQDYSWYDGELIRTAIGQSVNNLSCASMAKYIATLASRGTRYQMRLIDSIYDGYGQLIEKVEPNVEKQLSIKPENFDVVLEGMRRVTSETGGTAARVFTGFPITVAGKTGTAENGSSDDITTFGGFAPYEDPQVAIYVVIPKGNSTSITAPAARVAKDVLAAYFGLDRQPETAPATNGLIR